MSESLWEKIYQDQRAELEFRRNREQAIFMWTNSIIIGAIAWFIASDKPLGSLGDCRWLFSLVGIFTLTSFSLFWQWHQRKLMRKHQQVLAQVATLRGWFDIKTSQEKTLLPAEWKNWGNKKALGIKWWVTLALGVSAAALIFLSLCA